MTAWTTISNALVAVGAKPFATTIQALRDNMIAITEGAAGAPRVQLAAINRLTVGDSIRLRRDTLQTVNGTTYVAVFPPTPIIQSGSVRFNFEFRRTASNTAEVRVRRRRAGSDSVTTAVTNSTSTFAAGVIEIDVIPGDLISVEMRNTSSSDSEIRNCRLCVGASDFLWPHDTRATNGMQMFGEIEGNPAVIIP